MAEKKRIARIGNLSSGKGVKLHSDDDGLMQADSNLVYNIMQSMNKSQNILSYQQLQEFRSKEKPTVSNNSDLNPSNKQNSNSKQMKKFIPEKTFPLMAKCQKSMKYLKKNRCIPKPRAHVGFIPKPSQNPILDLRSNMDSSHAVFSNTVSHQESSVKLKQNSKKSRCSPEADDRLKASNSADNSCNKNTLPTQNFGKDSRFISETDSDNEFEQFLQKHHPEKYGSRKTEKVNKFKRKKRKELTCAKKIAKVTRKTLSESEESAESEVECSKTTIENNHEITNIDEEFSSNRFQRIIPYENDSSSDNHVNDYDAVNYDSFSSSEDEIIVNKALNKENVKDFDESERLITLPAGRCSVSSKPVSEREDTISYDDLLKLKCKTPCYVVIKRDPLLDRKAASLYAYITPVSTTVTFADEDDCIIISETATNNCTIQNSENNKLSIENRNSNQGEFTYISKSSCDSEVTTNINNVQNKDELTTELVFSSNSFKPQTETNSNKSANNVLDEKNMLLEVSSNATASRIPLCETEDERFTLSKATRSSHRNGISTGCEGTSTSGDMSNLPNNDTGALNCDGTTSAIEEVFNVKILSVASLNEFDIIVLSDDNEEKDREPVPTMNETKENATENYDADRSPVPTMNETTGCTEEDSDVEIICLDSSVVNKEKFEDVKDNLNNETHNKLNDGMKENATSSSSGSSVSVEDDCIILDELNLTSDNFCTANNEGMVEQSYQEVDTVNNEKTHFNVKTISSNVPNKNNEAILKLLGTIDFDSIKKVLNETTATGTQNESIPAKAENSLCDNNGTSKRTAISFPDKLTQCQPRLSEKQTSTDASILTIEVNTKISSLNTSPVHTLEKQPKFVQNSDALHNIKTAYENVTSPMKRNSKPSSSDCDTSSTVCIDLRTNLAAPKSFVSEEKILSSRGTELNTLPQSRKSQPSLPVHNTKMEYCETPSGELDIIASKSIQNLNVKEKDSILPLLELYRAEYEKYMQIKCTNRNVTDGLQLLQEKQTKKLMAISSSIKNLVKKDGCFHKINDEFNQNEPKGIIKRDPAEKDGSLNEIKKDSELVAGPSISSYPDIEKEDKVKIFNQSVVKIASEDLKSVGSSSTQEVYNHLINSKCAECGEHAVAACLGCAKIYYCSEKCGMTYWNKIHYATCER